MARPIFVRGLSTILTSILVVQFALADMAMAQSFPPVTGNPSNDPFWSNTAVTGLPADPNQNNFWFNAPPNPTDPTQPSSNDPWGGWTDPSGAGGGWNNSGPSGDWGNSSDPYSSLNNYWGTGTIAQPNPTDPFPVQIMKWTGIPSKNWAVLVRDDRIRYGAYSSEDNDALADIIIQKYSMEASLWGGATTVFPMAGAYLGAINPTGTSMGWGYGGGMVLGTLGDFIGVITAEANMMFELQQLYGELSNDPDERAAESMVPFYLGVGQASVMASVQKYFGLMGSNTPPVPPVPPPGPAPQPPVPAPQPPTPTPTTDTGAPVADQVQNAVKPSRVRRVKPVAVSPAVDNGAQAAVGKAEAPVLSAAEKAAAKKAAVEKAALEKAAAEKAASEDAERWAVTRWARQRRANFIAKNMDRASMQLALDTHLPQKLRNLAPPEVQKALSDLDMLKVVKSWKPWLRVAAAVTINFAFDYATCRAFGYWGKTHFKHLQKMNLANAVSIMRVNPRARTTLWLLMLRDFLPGMEDQNDAKEYAAILLKEIPLVRNAKHDELKQMLSDYKTNPKMIDDDLAELKSDAQFPTPAKLYFVKLLYAAALMRGYPTDHELKSVETAAIGLGLIPPAQLASQATQLEMQNPGDLRIVDKNRYYDMMYMMNKAANRTMFPQSPQQQVATHTNGVTRLWREYVWRSNLGKPDGYVVAQKWRSGQIILQDYQDSGVPDAAELLDEIKANQGIQTPAIQKQEQVVTQKIVNPPGTTVQPTGQPTLPTSGQQPLSTNVPGQNPQADPFQEWNTQNPPAPTTNTGVVNGAQQGAPVPPAPNSLPKGPTSPTQPTAGAQTSGQHPTS